MLFLHKGRGKETRFRRSYRVSGCSNPQPQGRWGAGAMQNCCSLCPLQEGFVCAAFDLSLVNDATVAAPPFQSEKICPLWKREEERRAAIASSLRPNLATVALNNSLYGYQPNASCFKLFLVVQAVEGEGGKLQRIAAV